jgi:hypothetical protein
MVFAVFFVAVPTSFTAEEKDWQFSGTAIESCSCLMFRLCYFNTDPALRQTEHGAEHFCKFNMAYKSNKGHYGDTDAQQN